MEMLWNHPLLPADGRRMQQIGSEQWIAEEETYLGKWRERQAAVSALESWRQ